MGALRQEGGGLGVRCGSGWFWYVANLTTHSKHAPSRCVCCCGAREPTPVPAPSCLPARFVGPNQLMEETIQLFLDPRYGIKPSQVRFSTAGMADVWQPWSTGIAPMTSRPSPPAPSPLLLAGAGQDPRHPGVRHGVHPAAHAPGEWRLVHAVGQETATQPPRVRDGRKQGCEGHNLGHNQLTPTCAGARTRAGRAEAHRDAAAPGAQGRQVGLLEATHLGGQGEGGLAQSCTGGAWGLTASRARIA